MVGVMKEPGTAYPSRTHAFIAGILVGFVMLIFLDFCVVLLCVFAFPVVMSVTIYAWQRCSVRLYLQLFVRGLMSYLLYLYLFGNSDVKHILCCVFALFFFVLLAVSLDCPFWISHRYSLTLIKHILLLINIREYCVGGRTCIILL
jgi:hypothetical protein